RRMLGQGQPAPSDTLRLGHIGIGGRGRAHLRPQAGLGKPLPPTPGQGGDGKGLRSPALSVALCDVDAAHLDAAATRVGGRPKTYRDTRRLPEDNAAHPVHIATPDHWHPVMTHMACKAGKDVSCEKPACNTIEEGGGMVPAADRYGSVVQI